MANGIHLLNRCFCFQLWFFFLSFVDSIFKARWIEFRIYWDMTTQINDDLIVSIERMRVNNRDRNIVTMHGWIFCDCSEVKDEKKQYKNQLKLPPAYLEQLLYLLHEQKNIFFFPANNTLFNRQFCKNDKNAKTA